MTIGDERSDGTVTKAQFAAIIGVSAGRVSQYIKAGQLDGAALAGQGRDQRIHLENGRAQLRARLDLAQMRGNGKDTRLLGATALVVSDGMIASLGSAMADHFHLQKREVLRFLSETIVRIAQQERFGDRDRDAT